MQLADVLPRFTDEAIAVIDGHSKANQASDSSEPLFLYLAYPAPHTPWLPSDEFAGKSQVGMYGDFVEMVDAMIGRVLAAIDSAGMSQDTLLIFSSDNGPVWYESDVENRQHDACGGWRGMKSDAWEAGHRVPFIVRWPGEVKAGTQSDQLLGFTDILATLAVITGTDLPHAAGPDSRDFSSALRSQATTTAESGRKTLVLKSGGGFMTIRDGDWKLIEGLGSGGFSLPRKVKPQGDEPSVQLYNLRNDPTESVNLAKEQPDQVLRLTELLKRVQAPVDQN
jgi:arylsulfatase A-like enzyme